MTSNNRSISLAGVLLALLIVPRAEATLMKAATFDEKVANSAAILLGHAVKKETRWNSTHRWILTYTTFRIEKSFKGLYAQQEITVVTPGGQVGDVHQDTSGIPELREGQDHVLFIRNSSEGPTVLYFDQGAYDVATKGNDRVVTPVESDAVQMDTQRGMAVALEGPRTVSEFEGAVRESQRRASFNRMQMIRRQQQQAQTSSLLSTLARYKYLIVIALLGAAIATWQLLRR